MPEHPDLEQAISDATVCTLIGNSVTKGTYPAWLQDKIATVPVVHAWPLPETQTPHSIRKRPHSFLWLGGSGAALKGLDIAIEAVKLVDDAALHVVGPVQHETDFFDAYRSDLTSYPGIHFHGFLSSGGAEFSKVLRQCGWVISTSASEGMSSSLATAMSCGLIPIASSHSGVDIDPKIGTIVTEEEPIAWARAMTAESSREERDYEQRARLTKSFADRVFDRTLRSAQIHSQIAALLDDSH